MQGLKNISKEENRDSINRAKHMLIWLVTKKWLQMQGGWGVEKRIVFLKNCWVNLYNIWGENIINSKCIADVNVRQGSFPLEPYLKSRKSDAISSVLFNSFILVLWIKKKSVALTCVYYADCPPSWKTQDKLTFEQCITYMPTNPSHWLWAAHGVTEGERFSEHSTWNLSQLCSLQ